MTLIWNRNKKLNATVLLLAIIVFITTSVIKKGLIRPDLKLSSQDTVINFNEHFVKSLDLGQHRLLSSALWSETLLKAGIEHHKEEDLNNWMFLRLKLITTLDPYFYSAYLYGGVYLSIVRDDDLGAEFIYDRGLTYYPEDYYLNINASFHYYYEVGKAQKSIRALEKIVNDPRIPPHLPSFLSRLKAEEQTLEDSIKYLKEMIKSVPQGSILEKRLSANLFNVQVERDLECLNQGLDQCRFYDPKGKPYVKNKKGLWISTSPWEKLRIKRKKKN